MWLAPLGLDSNLEITALCTYAEEKKWTKTECNRLIHLKDSQSMIRKKGIACQSLEQLLLQWRCLAIDSRLHQAPRVPTVSLVHNCPCTTASLSFPCNYRYLLDLARLSDWISSLSNRPEVVSTLQGKKGKKGKISVLKDERILFVKCTNQTLTYVFSQKYYFGLVGQYFVTVPSNLKRK